MKKIQLALIALMLLAGLVLYPQLPAAMPMHWNIRGEIDNYWPKEAAVWFMPALVLAMLILFRVLPTFDPKKEKYTLFAHEWQIMQTGLIGFFAYIYLVTLYLSLHPEVSMMPWMFVGLGALFVLMGNYMSKIRQNYFIGIRTPWTLASEENWNKTHRFASWCMVGAGIATLVEAVVIWYAPVVVFGSIMVGALLPVLYSFLLYKKSVFVMKYLLMGLVGVALLLGAVRTISPEDDWVCREGVWVRHGNPSATMPTKACEK